MKLPPFASIKPQLAMLVDEIPKRGPYVYEIKYDGYRAMAWLDHGKVRMASRSGKDWTHEFREIAGALSRLRAETAIVDGEVAYVDEEGRTDFQSLQATLGSASAEARGRLVYFAFDVVFLDGVDLRNESLTTRKDLLKALLAKEPLPIRFSDDVEDGAAFYREVCKKNLEGVVGKRADRPYLPLRTMDWIKLKCQKRQELVIVGSTPQRDAPGIIGALLVAVREGGGLRYAGKVGTGFSQATLRELEGALAPITVSAPTVKIPPNIPRIPHVRWVKPKLVAEVRFTEWTTDGVLRHPTFLGLRRDKPAEEIVHERSARDLSTYFELVAPVMFPFARSRPLELVPPADPKAAGLDRVRASGGRSSVIVATAPEQLAALGRAGVVEVRGWGSRLPKPAHPDGMFFALEPGPGLGFSDVVEAAFALRAALRTARLEAWVMTTGDHGLEVVVPLAARYTWTTTRGVADVIARIMADAAPERYAATGPDASNASSSAGRVAIDTSLNARGIATPLPYSPRMLDRPGDALPVAAPVDWEDLRALDPGELTTTTVPKLLAKQRRPRWAALLEEAQALPRALLDAAR